MPILLAFSGGLDTSFCIPFLRDTYGEPVHAVTVDTGGVDDPEALAERAEALGAAAHHLIDAREALFVEHLRYLIAGNVMRGQVYPLCVGAERVVQAREVARLAEQLGARTVAHGSTGAGNDQVRFDVALRALGGDALDVIAPVREHELSREESTAYLKERGFAAPSEGPSNGTAYSVNRGLWGATVGGRETHTSRRPLPDAAYPDTVAPADAPDEAQTLTLSFEEGIPTALDGDALDPVPLIEALAEMGGKHGVGRGVHTGDTVLGIKGRVGFEAPAATILIAAHRELEKIVLTQAQRFQKNHLADTYGALLHEGQHFDPVMRDIEAFLESSQAVVTGEVDVELFKGNARVLGCDSPFSMMDAGSADYGETHRAWDGRDAEGFSKITGMQSVLAGKARSAMRDS
ncbi:MAG: argininosuccinate synthase [Bacteroidetes bacterium QS_8_68_15]|nr:MAG: argininosuccinate synthase [Bacteroidetes bacterium QS_8_68_15]